MENHLLNASGIGTQIRTKWDRVAAIEPSDRTIWAIEIEYRICAVMCWSPFGRYVSFDLAKEIHIPLFIPSPDPPPVSSSFVLWQIARPILSWCGNHLS